MTGNGELRAVTRRPSPVSSSSRAATVERPDRSRAGRDPDEPQVIRARTGDLRAFETLVGRHRDVVFRVAARVVGDHDADDVSQDAFLRAFHRLNRFRGTAPFRAWLLQITHNAALDHLARRHEERYENGGFHDGPADDLPSTDRPPAERLDVRERTERLELKLRALSPERRVALVLRDVEGFSYAEIAEITSTPLATVKSRVHRARNDLVALLRTNTFDWELPR
ncbi:MAG: rpoE [Solirubrobacterales bacterium]|nr:rpoE [Solirubrobacterales bacterium]